jgi:hypothetical protein
VAQLEREGAGKGGDAGVQQFGRGVDLPQALVDGTAPPQRLGVVAGLGLEHLQHLQRVLQRAQRVGLLVLVDRHRKALDDEGASASSSAAFWSTGGHSVDKKV